MNALAFWLAALTELFYCVSQKENTHDARYVIGD